MNSATDHQLAAVIILAAGEGKRMKSARPKFLHPVAGRSILHRVLDAATGLRPEHVAVVVGNGRDQVEAHLDEVAPHAVRVAQGDEAYGTGYAAQCAMAALPDLHGDVVITVGDAPLQDSDALAALVATHRDAGAVATVLTATAPDPTGYGRIVRGADGAVTAIVEHKDATPEQQ
ncbi:MAG TPA: NTP transferase domain-containing protein, partial [Microlunatus sp.]|nr:NTP transferase domain-containing protein [Microlunatus sp.]